jgi:thiol-disulfide isomerase/thioredoxin
LPELKKMVEEGGAKLAKKFQVLALHESSSIKSLKELDPKIERFEKGIWNGKLPFPILIDSKEGETLKRFAIQAFPTTVLIDPQGKVRAISPSKEQIKKFVGI